MEDKLQWNLDDILKTEDFDAYYQETEKLIAETDKYFELLSPTMSEEDFVKVIDFEEMMGERFARLGYLPSLMEEVNQKDEKAKLMKSRVTDLGLKFSPKVRKISQWMKGKEIENKPVLDDNNAKRLFATIPELEYSLNYSRQAAKHTLKLAEEEIIDNKDSNGVEVLTDLRAIIETEFEYVFEPEGQSARVIKTQSELMKYAHSPVAAERVAAYEAMLTKHKDNIDKFFAIYQAVVKDWDYEARLRGYSSPIGVRNFANHIPDEAINTLLEVCRENSAIFHRYFRIKAKELGLEKLKREDIYAPLESKSRKYPLSEAWKMVEEAFGNFGTGFVDKARRIVDDKHIDSHPGEQKRSGAFCATVTPKLSPYVLLNHTDDARDVSTLAHELGHGIHSLYASHLRASVQHANLPLAETASTTGEMILFEKLYERETDAQIKKAMLSEKISDSYASIVRQNYFILFEIKAHEAISKGVTAKELGEMWLQTLKEQFGDAVEVDPLFAYEWSYIPHIVNSPFYCYAYNFGELLSLSLYARYKKEGQEFVPKLEKILAYGGSKDPDLVLKEVGIDMRDKKFWKGSFDVIEGWINSLEGMVI